MMVCHTYGDLDPVGRNGPHDGMLFEKEADFFHSSCADRVALYPSVGMSGE